MELFIFILVVLGFITLIKDIVSSAKKSYRKFFSCDFAYIASHSDSSGNYGWFVNNAGSYDSGISHDSSSSCNSGGFDGSGF